ncbi:MAG: hypothetical protein KDI72_12450, partial [Xanthomonadales bacterium]|nr:hypothetical protein [Xanthomonadales bacterium]
LLDEDKADAAARALEELRGEFGTDPAFADLSQKIQQRQEAQAGAERIRALLDKARGALAAGRISEPAGNNAFDWFEQA